LDTPCYSIIRKESGKGILFKKSGSRFSADIWKSYNLFADLNLSPI